MHAQSHTIVRLPIHMPDQQPVYFQEDRDADTIVRAASRATMLTDWFTLNEEDTSARDYLYTETPTKYVFNQATKRWTAWKRGGNTIIPRMCSVSPADNDRFLLRILLLHVKGATSFEALHSVDGQVADSFKDAGRLHNLLADDKEWINTLTEATAFQMPSQMRGPFATICTSCMPSDPLRLWTEHKHALSEDFGRNNTAAVAENMALAEIETVLIQSGLSCAGLGLPTPTIEALVDARNHPEYDVAAEADIGELNMTRLNQELADMAAHMEKAVKKAVD